MVAIHHAEFDSIFAKIGAEHAHGPSDEVIREAQQVIAELLHIRPYDQHSGRCWGAALGALVELADDPDKAVPQWLQSFTPLGIEHDILALGIFPRLTPEEQELAIRASAPVDYASLGHLTNYSSYSDYRDLADQELRRELQAGFAISAPTRAELEAVVGPLDLSKVGVIVKAKGDRVKVCLTHDLSRSGVNHKIWLPERVVLPRLSDVIEATMKHLASRTPHIAVDMLVHDFRDALKQLHVHPDEQ